MARSGKVAMAGVDKSCGLCGGMHFGTRDCPFLKACECSKCGHPILRCQLRHFGEVGTPEYGKVFHVGCAPSGSYICQVQAPQEVA